MFQANFMPEASKNQGFLRFFILETIQPVAPENRSAEFRCAAFEKAAKANWVDRVLSGGENR
jgi:hypothetical protein